MKGYSLYKCDDLRYEELDEPQCPPGWSIVKVKYAGICSSDIPRIFTKGTYHFPTIPGHEFSGIVDRVADDKDKALLGRKVGVFPLIPCRTCEQCRQGHYEMCSSYDYIGSRRDGGFAEYVAVPVWNLVPLPDSVSLKEAAMLEPLSVALHAIKQSHMKSGDTVAIIGTGMIAFAAGQWASKFSAGKVTILGRNEAKREITEKIPGLSYCLLEQNREEFDVVIEAVGSNEAIEHAINSVKPGGKLVLMGNPEGTIALSQNTYWRILRKQLNLCGTWNSSYEKDRICDWTEARDALEQKEIDASLLITHLFHQTQLKEGLEMMRLHKEPYCKVMTLWNEEAVCEKV